MAHQWTKEEEELILKLRDEEKMRFKAIAERLPHVSVDAIKIKYRRLKYDMNKDQYHHPEEKTEQVDKILKGCSKLKILETHAGWGNLTSVYSKYSKSLISLEIEQDRVDVINDLKLKNTTVIKCDSEKEIHRFVYEGKRFDVIDLDPYGFASRYFPHVFKLIDNGYLFLTFPKLGINRVTPLMVEHYRLFWDLDTKLPEKYLDTVVEKVKDYGLCHHKVVEMVDYIEIGRMYRIAFKVTKVSAFKINGMRE